MTFLAPAFFYASLGVAAAIAALHFIVTRQPRAGILPTARFVPDMPATATARATRPSDIPLMLLRMLLVLAAGAGLAKPVIKPTRTATANVILADVSRSVADLGTIRDSVRRMHGEGDVVIAFDSAARTVAGPDSLAHITPSTARGNLSAALVAAMRAGSALRERADSIRLVIVSPLAADVTDAATEHVREMWPGEARLVVAGRPIPFTSDGGQRVSIRGAANDPLAITLAGHRPTSNALVVRDGSSVSDGARPIVEWPVSARPPGAIARSVRDTIGGVVAGESVVVASFERRWSYPPDSIRGAEVVARWIDGEVAAVEWKRDSGCARSVAIPVNPTGDLVLREDFRRLFASLTLPCTGSRAFVPAADQSVRMLAGAGGLAPREEFQPRGDTRSWLAPWLLGLALLLAIAELFVRRRRTEAAALGRRERTSMASAA